MSIGFPSSPQQLFNEVSSYSEARLFYDYSSLRAPNRDIEESFSKLNDANHGLSVSAERDLRKKIQSNLTNALQDIPSQRTVDIENMNYKQKLSKLSGSYRVQNNKDLSIAIKQFDFNQYDSRPYHNSIFLSYSVTDLAIATALFFWFFQRGTFLYVDYLFNSKSGSQQLKNILITKLWNADQYLLADSIENQIKLGSSYYIRPWCAWENGVFLGQRHPAGTCFRLNWYNQEITGYSAKSLMTEDMLSVHAYDAVTHQLLN